MHAHTVEIFLRTYRHHGDYSIETQSDRRGTKMADVYRHVRKDNLTFNKFQFDIREQGRVILFIHKHGCKEILPPF